jgi:hypothetical protein
MNQKVIGLGSSIFAKSDSIALAGCFARTQVPFGAKSKQLSVRVEQPDRNIEKATILTALTDMTVRLTALFNGLGHCSSPVESPSVLFYREHPLLARNCV